LALSSEHIEYIRNITGPDHVGLGGDYDGIERVSVGLEDVSKYPDLIQALWDTGRWTEEDLEKLSGRNLLRVFRAVEKVNFSFYEIPISARIPLIPVDLIKINALASEMP